MTTAITELTAPSELEPDNSTRLAIFDAVSDAAKEGHTALTVDELFERVIGRLRLLVPRELHIAGERAYLEDKVGVCVNAGLLTRGAQADDQVALAPDAQSWIRYPDYSIRRYPHGLIAARERLDVVNNALRTRAFDVVRHVPHHSPSSPEFRALVCSMREHGFLKQFAIFRYPDGKYVDGVARVQAAKKAEVDVKWLELEKMGDPEATRARRRDTPLNRVLLALDSNATRLTEEDRQRVHDAVTAAAGRSWADIEADLILTRAWRQATARSYVPTFETTKKLPFESGGIPQILITHDHKVHVTSLLRAVGLAKHKFDKELKDWVHHERARVPGEGPPATFARVTDMIDGIEAMVAERRAQRRKISPEWNVSLDWLRTYVRERGVDHNGDGRP
jgi:hypothetical protein